VLRSENDILVFISSRMDAEMDGARKIAIDAIKSIEFGRPWAFECSPASSESADVSYLRKVREADFVVWLVGRESTPPVVDEVSEAIALGRRLLVFKLPADQRDDSTLNLIERSATMPSGKSFPVSRNCSGGMADALRSGRSAPCGRGSSNLPFGTTTFSWGW
jgi:hypothetical protein